MATKGKFTLEIETENLAAWMVINNTFAWEKNEDFGKKERYWSGILIQLGQYKNWSYSNLMDGFESIKLFKGTEELAPIKASEFNEQNKPSWINIVVRTPGSEKDLKDPMNRGHLEKLRIAPAFSLDKFFFPHAGGITLWSENGFELQVKNNEVHKPHKTYTFTTFEADEYEVDFYMKGAPVGDKSRAIDRLRICEPPEEERHSLYHGSHDSPPNEP